MRGKAEIIVDLWNFLRVRKQWWLLPMLAFIVLFGLLLVFAQASPLAPVIYTLI